MLNLKKVLLLAVVITSLSACSLSSEKAATITSSPLDTNTQTVEVSPLPSDISPTALPINPDTADQELLEILEDLDDIDLDSEFSLLDEQLN